MLDALYQDSINRVLDDQQARPQPRPAPEPGFWAGIWSAAPRGFAVAVNETVRTGYRAITANADAVMLRQQQEADDFTAEAIFRRRLELADERKLCPGRRKHNVPGCNTMRSRGGCARHGSARSHDAGSTPRTRQRPALVKRHGPAEPDPGEGIGTQP